MLQDRERLKQESLASAQEKASRMLTTTTTTAVRRTTVPRRSDDERGENRGEDSESPNRSGRGGPNASFLAEALLGKGSRGSAPDRVKKLAATQGIPNRPNSRNGNSLSAFKGGRPVSAGRQGSRKK